MKSFINQLLNRPVVLDLYTTRQDVIKYSHPLPASKVHPEWWKALPKEVGRGNNMLGGLRTMKHCLGFTELFKHGIFLPLWTDLEIEVGPIGSGQARWQFADLRSVLAVHPEIQRGSYLPDTHYLHLKLDSSWKAVCNEDVSWLFLQPSWNFEQPERQIIPSAAIDFKYQCGTHINMFIPRTQQTETLSFAQGQPILHLLPITERRVEYRTHLITQEEYDNLGVPNLWFTDTYKKNKKLTQKEKNT